MLTLLMNTRLPRWLEIVLFLTQLPFAVCSSHALEDLDVFVPTPLTPGKIPSYTSSRVNGRLAHIKDAPPHRIINMLDPFRSIVGATLLPKDKYFSIKFSDKPPPPEKLLEALGANLGLRIQTRLWKGTFLVARLPETGIPRFWELAGSEELVKEGMIPGDGGFELTRVIGMDTSVFLRTFSFRTHLPLVDGTGLRRRYNFAFKDNNHSFTEAITAAGLALEQQNLERACIVIDRQ
jgi:hypothetical protein